LAGGAEAKPSRVVPESFVSGLASPRKIFPEQLVTFEKFIRGLYSSFKISHFEHREKSKN
jgi:hypothetical protein